MAYSTIEAAADAAERAAAIAASDAAM